jgi:uncharacterized membrane protein
VETIVGNLLRAGVVLAGLVTAVGAVWFLVQHGSEPCPKYDKYPLPSGTPSDLSEISRLALALHSPGLIMLGVLLLIATPIARVIFSVAAFVVQRDWMYVTVTLIVLTILLYSFCTGLFGV